MFCANCGKEVSNDACVCIGCGCLVKKIPEQKQKTVTKDSTEKNQAKGEFLARLFAIIAIGCFSLAFIFLFAMMTWRASSMSYSMCVFFGIISFLLATAAFVLSLVMTKNKSVRFNCICVFLLSFIVLIVPML